MASVVDLVSTQVFLRDLVVSGPDNWHSGVSAWNPNTAFDATGQTGWTIKSTRLSRGPAKSAVTAGSVASGTSRYRFLAATPYMFVSPPIDRDVTISSNVTLNLWSFESSMNANVQIACYIARIKADGTVDATPLVASGNFGTEMGTVAAVANYTSVVTSTNMLKGDRLLIVPYFTNIGTQASGFTITFDFDGPTSAADGDSYVTFAEDFGFIEYGPTDSTLVAPTVSGGSARAFGQASAGPSILAISLLFAHPITLNSVVLNLLKTGSPSDNVRASLQADSGGDPSGTLLTSATVAGTSLTTSLANYTFDWADFTAAADTRYWLVFDRTGATSDADYYSIRGGPAADREAGFMDVAGSKQFGVAWSSNVCIDTFTLNVANPGSVLYPTDTTGAVDPGGATYDSKEMWTSRGGGSATAVTNTANTPASPILATKTAGGNFVEWYSRQLQAFTLGGVVVANIRNLESSASANATVGAELAVCAADGTGATVWGFNLYSGESVTSDAAFVLRLSGNNVSVSAGQRLRLRLYIDDSPLAAMATGFTVTFSYAGTSGGATGDTFLTFPQTLLEQAAAGTAIPPGLLDSPYRRVLLRR